MQVDRYRDQILGTNTNVVRLGQSSRQTGRQMVQVGQQATRAAREGSRAFSAFNDRMRVMGGALVGYFSFRSIFSGLSKVSKESAAFEEDTNKFNVVFRGLEKQAGDWADNYAERVGRSRVETRASIGETQNMLVGFGATRKEGFELSKSIQQMGVDLASFNNLADDDAVNRLRSGLLGNHEAVRNLGVILNETTLNMEAQRMGIRANFKDLDPLTKIQVRYATVVRQSQDAVGDANRTTHTFTSQLKRLQGNFKDSIAEGGSLNVELGKMIVKINENFDAVDNFIKSGINIATEGIGLFSEAIKFARENSETFIPVLGGVAAAFGTFTILKGVNSLVLAFNSGLLLSASAALATQGPVAALNVLIAANPFGAAAIAIGALVAGSIALYRNWDTVKAKGSELFSEIQERGAPIFEFFGGVIKSLGKGAIEVFSTISNNFRGVINFFATGLNTIIRAINRIKIEVPDFVPKFGGEEFSFNIPEVPMFQRGTMNTPLGAAIVGEQGPELVRFSRGARIDTAPTTRRILNANKNIGSVDQSVNNPMNVNVNVEIHNNIKGSADVEKLSNNTAKAVRREIDVYFRNMATAEGLVLRRGTI